MNSPGNKDGFAPIKSAPIQAVRLQLAPVQPTSFQLALFSLAASVAALAAAYVSQYGFGLHPCQMCYWQRIPYALVIVLALASLLSHRERAGFARALLVLCVAAFAAGAAIAAFHAGVEWRLWEGPGACSGGIDATLSVEEMRAKILGAPAVSCSEAAFRFLGVSMAGWNAVYSGLCALALAAGLRRAGASGKRMVA